jgi:hypothetical protein
MEIETANWSGEGTFTQVLIDRLRDVDRIAALRVEDAPSTRSDFDYNFVSNEIFVTFRLCRRRPRPRWLRVLPAMRFVMEPAMTIEALAVVLGGLEGVGPADFVDQGMIQYLRTERIVPPYQTRGFKLVEMVRIYEAGTPPRP